MKTNTRYIFIGSLLFALLGGALIFFTREQIAQKIEVVKEYYLKESQNKNVDFGNRLQKEAELLSSQEQVLQQAFLKSSELVPFITKLETTASNIGATVVVEKVERGAEESVGSVVLEPITFSIRLTGSFDQISQFVTFLSQLPEILHVEEFKMYQTEPGSSVYDVRILVTGNSLRI
jgi:Tfp pilus assembly protein PilO